MKAVYKVFREENGEVVLDLTVKREGDTFQVIEDAHKIDIKDLSSDELNMVLSELHAPENIKLEIKKAVLNKQVGFLEDKKQQIDELMPRLKYDANNIRTDFEIEYHEMESRIKQEIEEFEKKFEDLLKKFK